MGKHLIINKVLESDSSFDITFWTNLENLKRQSILLQAFILVPIGAKLKCEEVKDGVGNRRKKLI